MSHTGRLTPETLDYLHKDCHGVPRPAHWVPEHDAQRTPHRERSYSYRVHTLMTDPSSSHAAMALSCLVSNLLGLARSSRVVAQDHKSLLLHAVPYDRLFSPKVHARTVQARVRQPNEVGCNTVAPHVFEVEHEPLPHAGG